MKFVCSGQELAGAIARVGKAISGKKTNPILECVKISAENDFLKISATDMELSIQKIIKCETFVNGDFLIPYKVFSEFVTKLPDEDVEISSEDGSDINLRYGNSSAKFHILSTLEYPPMDTIDEIHAIYLDSKELKKIITSVVYAVATDDIRPIFKGVNFIISGKKLTVVALDGYRMGVLEDIVIETDGEDDYNIIVNSRSLLEIVKIIDTLDGKIKLSISSNKLMLDLKHTVIVTRLFGGDFVNYKNIIPLDFNTKVIVSVKTFREALERANLVAKNEKNNSVTFEVQDGRLLILGENEMYGMIEEDVAIEREGKDITIKFNAKYVLDCLSCINSEAITINIKNSGTACTFIPVNNENHINLILPVKNNY